MYSVCFSPSDLLYSVQQTLGSSTSLQMTQFHSFLWLSNGLLCTCTTSSSQWPSMVQFPAASPPSPASLPFFTRSTSAELTCVAPCAHQAPLLLVTLHWLFPIWNALFHACACLTPSPPSNPLQSHLHIKAFLDSTCSLAPTPIYLTPLPLGCECLEKPQCRRFHPPTQAVTVLECISFSGHRHWLCMTLLQWELCCGFSQFLNAGHKS